MTATLYALSIGSLALEPPFSPPQSDYTVRHKGAGQDAISATGRGNVSIAMTLSNNDYVALDQSSQQLTWTDKSGSKAKLSIHVMDENARIFTYRVLLINEAT